MLERLGPPPHLSESCRGISAGHVHRQPRAAERREEAARGGACLPALEALPAGARARGAPLCEAKQALDGAALACFLHLFHPVLGLLLGSGLFAWLGRGFALSRRVVVRGDNHHGRCRRGVGMRRAVGGGDGQGPGGRGRPGFYLPVRIVRLEAGRSVLGCIAVLLGAAVLFSWA